MTLNYNLCDDWGWYIDVEHSGLYDRKQYIKLHVDQEYDDNEYNYYLQIHKKNDINIEYLYCNGDDDECLDYTNNEKYIDNILTITTTVMITAILTYMILFP